MRKFLFSCVSAFALTAAVAANAGTVVTNGPAAPAVAPATAPTTAASSTGSATVTTTAPAAEAAKPAAQSAVEAYKADWKNGAVTIVHPRAFGEDLDKRRIDLLRVDPREAASYVSESGKSSFTEALSKLPVRKPVFPATLESNGILVIQEDGTYVISEQFTAPSNGTPMTCAVSVRLNDAEILRDPEIRIGGFGSSGPYDPAVQVRKSDAIPLRAGNYPISWTRSCYARAYPMKPEQRDEYMASYFSGIESRYFAGENLKEVATDTGAKRYLVEPSYGVTFGTPAQSVESLLGAKDELLISDKTGNGAKSIAYGQIVHDANQSPTSTASDRATATFAPRGDVKTLDDKFASGWRVDVFQQGTLEYNKNWAAYDDSSALGGYYVAGAASAISMRGHLEQGRTSIDPETAVVYRLRTNMSVTHDGANSLFVALSNNRVPGSYTQMPRCSVSARLQSNGQWQPWFTQRVFVPFSASAIAMGTAKLPAGVYPTEISVACIGRDNNNNPLVDAANGSTGRGISADIKLAQNISIRALVKGAGEDTPRTPSDETFVVEATGSNLPALKKTGKASGDPIKVAPAAPITLAPTAPAQEAKSDNVRADNAAAIQASLAAGKEVDMTVTFATGKDELTVEGRKAVAQLAEALKAQASVKIMIEGHTDDVGGADSNLDLSKRRALSVAKELVQVHGIDVARLQAKGYGLTKPRVPNTSDANRSINRRVTVFKTN